MEKISSENAASTFADWFREKLDTTLKTLNSAECKDMITLLDSSHEEREELKKDPAEYLKKKDIKLPEGVDFEFIVENSPKKAKGKVKLEVEYEIET